MQVSIEISKYPLQNEYIKPIQGFIDRLNTYPELTVLTNTMSTQVFGDYDTVLGAVTKEMKTSFSEDIKAVMVMKFINSDLRP